MKRRRQAIKSRSIARINDRKVRALYKEVERQVRLVNARLSSLERKHDTDTWASGKLKTRIKANKTKGLLYKGKRIRLKPKMTKTNLVQIQKATKQFLDSATSTNKGIKKVRESTIKSLAKTLNFNMNKKLSDKDVEFLYETLEDKRVRNWIDEIGASALWYEIELAIDQHSSEYTFIYRLNTYLVQDMDDDLLEEAKHIYKTYVKF